MRIVVTGRKGQVVQSLLEHARDMPGIEIAAVGRPELDLARPDSIAEALAGTRPDVIVSAAAYTAVDQAEDEPGMAYAINEIGAGEVANAANRLGVPVIHLSTDYVFDGNGEHPYGETAQTAPRSVYGASKLAGERAVAVANPRHLVLRTAWVYSAFGGNFVRTMLRLAAERSEVPVVADQWGNPTSAHDIADAVLRAAARTLARDFDDWGIYHLAGTGTTNWSGFARQIFTSSRAYDGPFAEVKDIATADYPTKAHRPANSRLATEKFGSVFGWTAPDWKLSTDHVVKRLVTEASPSKKPG
ncbi:MAG: dTDP-4-dehydrorhamnose reductase [Mesorhizobium sp.]|nr:dTDP-4-dehydrorhamnose reductase [Mesorhizobium sp.]